MPAVCMCRHMLALQMFLSFLLVVFGYARLLQEAPINASWT